MISEILVVAILTLCVFAAGVGAGIAWRSRHDRRPAARSVIKRI